jgi:hypothetical protein
MANKPKAPSNASAFKKRTKQLEEPQLVELDDDLVVKVRRPYIGALIQKGIIPGQLAAAQIRAQQAVAYGRELSDKDAERLTKLRTTMVILSVVEPRVKPANETPDYDNGEISITDLSDAEILAIYTFIQGGAEALEQFRNIGQSVSDGPDSEEVSRNPTERPIRSQKPGKPGRP